MPVWASRNRGLRRRVWLTPFIRSNLQRSPTWRQPAGNRTQMPVPPPGYIPAPAGSDYIRPVPSLTLIPLPWGVSGERTHQPQICSEPHWRKSEDDDGESARSRESIPAGKGAPGGIIPGRLSSRRRSDTETMSAGGRTSAACRNAKASPLTTARDGRQCSPRQHPR